jgi:RNA-binding protein YhbY
MVARSCGTRASPCSTATFIPATGGSISTHTPAFRECKGGSILNPKIQKTIRQIEQTKAKIAGLQALLPELQKQQVALENEELIKVARAAHTKTGDFTEVIQALQDSFNAKPVSAGPMPINEPAEPAISLQYKTFSEEAEHDEE